MRGFQRFIISFPVMDLTTAVQPHPCLPQPLINEMLPVDPDDELRMMELELSILTKRKALAEAQQQRGTVLTSVNEIPMDVDSTTESASSWLDVGKAKQRLASKSNDDASDSPSTGVDSLV